MGRKLALVIGNSTYEDRGLARLAAPAADVQAFAEILRDPKIGEFDEVVPLVNEGFAVVRRMIARFFDKKRRDDLLLLYFSGHGVRDEHGQLYMAVKDTERSLLAGTAIEASFISACMDRSQSKRLVLVLDCCHSGAFAQGAKADLAGCVGTATAFQGLGRGRVVLTATDSTQYAWEGDRVIGEAENSLFTHYLIDGLRTGAADHDRDGLVTVDELYDFVYDRVLNDTPAQTPGKWAFGQQGDIVIARNPRLGDAAAVAEAVVTPPSRSRLARRARALGRRIRRGLPRTLVGRAGVAVLTGAAVAAIVARDGFLPGEAGVPAAPTRPALTVAAPLSMPGLPNVPVEVRRPPEALPATPEVTSSPSAPATGRAVGDDRAMRLVPPRTTPRPAAIEQRGGGEPAAMSARRQPETPVARNETVEAGPTRARSPVVATTPATRGSDALDRAIDGVLGRYERAFESLNVQALRQVHPSMTSSAAKRYERTFAGARECRVDLHVTRRDVSEPARPRVEADVTFRYSMKVSVAFESPVAVPMTFWLEQRGADWVIARVEP
jgi:uncharacterized caspase-like protein